ncbi:hypothetical protein BJG93_25920 [Paraburkholderia sprentiae WSM5005]|uniref:Uncharacterized protein n=1 Tax=Paraburkholderia sprentiae WSM5005 TaxID=754502 RepID=A0A1I9YRA2_9BURK|nr:hypothetical protein [Paraburkholderia sprentiae]APA88743.1 hypothetical protein BJG93_25920 [Paraburkholderia sprentiae WSM5005]
MAALGSTAAWANDIQCASTQQPAERVICDHAILNNEYDDIFAQQQALLSSGKLSSAQLARWRQARNACIDVHCVDGVFAQWKTMARSVETVPQAAVPAVPVSETAMAPVGPNPDAPAVPSASDLPQASQASPTSEASLVRQGSAAGVALPQPVAPEASAPVAASAAPRESESRGMPGMSGGLILGLLVAIGIGALFAVRNRGRATAKKTQGKDV